MGASMPQGDVGGRDAASAPGRTAIPVVSQVSSETFTKVAMMTARTASRDEILRPPEPEMEREPEVEPQNDVPMEQRTVETPLPRPSGEFFHAHLEVLDGDVRRNTLQAMLAVSGA
jgi:hypothetical protein